MSGLGGFGSPSNTGGAGTRAPKLSFELKGLGRLHANFRKYSAGLIASKMGISGSVANDIAEAAQALVAEDTGRTKANITVRRTKDGAEVVATRGGQRDVVPAVLELGSYRMAARPFMVPAMKLVLQAQGVKRAARNIGGLLSPTGLTRFG